jgi:hypothetical protein
MSISFFAMRHQPDALFLTAVRRECDETAEMRERRHSATASVEKVFCSRQELSERGTMLVNFTDQGLKGVKDVPKSPAEAGPRTHCGRTGLWSSAARTIPSAGLSVQECPN